MKYRAYKTLWEECIRDNKVRRILVIELILRNSMDNKEQKTEEFKNRKRIIHIFIDLKINKSRLFQ